MSTRIHIIVAIASGLLVPLLSSQSKALDCISGLRREDDSWQNRYAENRCNKSITLRYTLKDKDGTTRGTAFAGPCKKTRVIRTFLSNEIDFCGGQCRQGEGLPVGAARQNAAYPSVHCYYSVYECQRNCEEFFDAEYCAQTCHEPQHDAQACFTEPKTLQ
jgi:hypothetical protein